MVQGKKAFNNSKPKFAEVVIGDSEAKDMRVAANGRPSRSPYLKLVYPQWRDAHPSCLHQRRAASGLYWHNRVGLWLKFVT